MKGLDRQRVAYWTEVVIAVVVAFSSIWLAARIGYRAAVRFTQYEELRDARNLVRAAEEEMALNERAIGRALDDWDGREYRELDVATRSFERLRDSAAFFALARPALEATRDAYAESLRHVLEEMRTHRSGMINEVYAQSLTYHLEKLREARPLLAGAIAGLEREMADYDVEDAMPSRTPRAGPAAKSTPALAPSRAPSPGWRAETPGYRGPLDDFGWDQLAVPASTRGPLWIWLAGNSRTLPEGRRASRVLLFLCPRAPLRLGHWLYAGQDDDELRRIFAGQGQGVTVLSHAVTERSIEIVDTNVELRWRWMYALLEDDAGARHPFAQSRAWKAGADSPERFSRDPSAQALGLPLGYLRH